MRARSFVPVSALLLLLAAVGVGAASSRATDWRSPSVLLLLLAFAVIADRFEIRLRSGAYAAGWMPVFVLTAVVFGPAPAGAIGATVAMVQRRKQLSLMLIDVAHMTAFPLAAGLFVRTTEPLVGDGGLLWWVLLVVVVFMVAWVVNGAIVAAFTAMLRGRRSALDFFATWPPLVGTQLAHAIATAGLVYGYVHLGPAIIVLAGVLTVTYSRLQRDLVTAERLRDETEQRNAELAAVNERLRRSHMGAMRSLVRSIHLHDQMTARHSAAVARYARAMAAAAGCSEHEQHTVHTAGLLHDVGKHILDDAILKGDTKLNESQWELVKRHPEEGARIVRLLEGHEEIAEIIHAHHERIDGRGYPRGLGEPEIPLLSRMISIADTYDVMTARDSYRDPVAPEEAVAELRRVSGAQLDGELVEIFVRDVLGQAETAFGHGDDADFEAELEFGPLGAGASAVEAGMPAVEVEVPAHEVEVPAREVEVPAREVEVPAREVEVVAREAEAADEGDAADETEARDEQPTEAELTAVA
jgi:putative nucleotidyltransferase with HDIG domain